MALITLWNAAALFYSGRGFVYDSKNDEIFLNEELLVKNIPARMLRKIIQHYIDGNTVFERKMFLNDTSIVLDRFNPGIEIRLKRLLLTIAEHCPLLIITKSARGKYGIDVRCKITITD